MRFLFPISLIFTLACSSQALEIRSYSPTRHDRFITADGVTTPNAGAYYDASLYTGVGYASTGGQFALITPEHVLFANHFAPPIGFTIRFRNNDGQEFRRTVSALITVPNGLGGTADVLIIKLNAPISEELGITPLPYLNLASEALYSNTVITMFGNTRRAGRGGIFRFSNYSDSNIDSTRAFRSIYFNAGSNQDDAHAVGGDSGSPSFATPNGNPALVGIHLAVLSIGFGVATIDTFIPEYAGAINTLLDPEGYALIPANTSPVSLTEQIFTEPLRQAEPASIEITLTNSTQDNAATNPRLNLLFPPAAIPDSVTAPGWIVENPSPGDYRLRSATLSANSAITATITYSTVPPLDEISIQASHISDGSTALTDTYDLPVTQTFGGYVSGLALNGELDDPDFDGISNLLEYAFGGNPATNSNLAEGGYPLAPQSSSDTGILTFTYSRRTDASARGLTYTTEFLETLNSTPWSTTLPAGASSSVAPFDPDVLGYEQVTVSIPTSSPEKNFVRVRVTLAE